ncbi:hypothetical protein LI82_06340 [Methanococcoides methylutens]|uniref:Uncharacterized protein n=1 Tax=Methanococcoides methylutens TaxID=2226 RepID=A0A099T1U5_METMT|nr:hypothetical protein [Methanococcoides methylutens]KGK98904.1 hypothetical protein LI82_06340 [Methanococcoides methylutens]
MNSKEEASAVTAGNENEENRASEELTDEELDELMMEQSKAPGCKKHRGYGKFDKPPVNRGVALSSDDNKGQGEKEDQK